MQSHHLRKVKAELDIAERRLAEMRTSKNFSELALLWSDFLNVHQRIFNKMRKAAKSGPEKGWFDQIVNERSTDELLSYLHQARHADEHGLEDITKKVDHNLRVSFIPRADGRPIYIDRIGLTHDGTVIVGPSASRNTHITFTAGHVELIPIVNRGVTYVPPTIHLGNTLSLRNAVDAASHCLTYMRNIVVYAEKNFVS